MRAWVRGVWGAVALAAGSGAVCAAESAQPPSLADALAVIQSHRFVDLTHAFAPGIPHWKGAPNETVKTLYTVAKDGFKLDEFCHIGQWGTHVDPPAHFHTGMHTVDQIDLNYVISLDDIHDWEMRHGTIPHGSFVAMRTDWSKRWPNDAAIANRDAAGVYHYPGWSKEVLKVLYEERGITASGHETTDTDPGLSTTKEDYSLESYILGLNHYQIELLANLDQVPEAGALVWVSFPKAEHGSGFPARVIAVVP
jgi:kynurenine formamidase